MKLLLPLTTSGLSHLVDKYRRRPIGREFNAVREHLAQKLAAVEQRQLEADVDRRGAEAERGGGVGLQLQTRWSLI